MSRIDLGSKSGKPLGRYFPEVVAARGRLLEREIVLEVPMQLTLSDAEARTLRELLAAYLPDLKREVAGTDAKEFRHHLIERQELAERLLALLQQEEPFG